MKQLYFIGIFTLISLASLAQTYPKGIYTTYESFKNRLPNDTLTVFEIKTRDTSNAFRFVNKATNKRLKRNFAISDGMHLYIRIKEVFKHLPRNDKNQSKDDGNFCIKVEEIGSRYLYFEDYFTSKEALILGGLAAGASARRLKGIVYDFKTHQFDLFKNAKDFAYFIEKNHPEYVNEISKVETNTHGKKKRKKFVEDLDLIRKIITEINQK